MAVRRCSREMGDNMAAAKRAAETSRDLKTQAKVKYFGYQITARPYRHSIRSSCQYSRYALLSANQ